MRGGPEEKKESPFEDDDEEKPTNKEVQELGCSSTVPTDEAGILQTNAIPPQRESLGKSAMQILALLWARIYIWLWPILMVEVRVVHISDGDR